MNQLGQKGKSSHAYLYGMIFTLASAVLWGSTYPTIKLALSYYDAYNISLYRSLYACLALAVFLLFAKKEMLPRKEDLPLLFIGSILGAAGFWTLLNISVEFLDPDTSAFLVALYPLIAVVLATIVLHEKMTIFAGAGVVLGLFGTYLIIALGEKAGLSGSQPILGAISAVLAALSWAGYMVTTKVLSNRRSKSGKQASPEYITYNNFLLAIPTTAIVTLVSNSGANFLTFSPVGMAYMAYLGIITSGLAFLIFNVGIKLIGVSGAGINQLVFPAVSVLLSYVIFGETLNYIEVAGMILIVSGIAVAQFVARK